MKIVSRVGAVAIAALLLSAGCLAAASSSSSATVASSTSSSSRVKVTITGGHATSAVDNGRPVVLVAAVLGVPPEVFREAFSHVTPAAAGEEPDPTQVGLNKEALLAVLAPYGVTNESLDRASNYYRYNGSAGEMWPTVRATAKAVVKNGRVTRVVITNPGAGYTSAPTIKISGARDVTLTATVRYTTRFATNGSLSAINVS